MVQQRSTRRTRSSSARTGRPSTRELGNDPILSDHTMDGELQPPQSYVQSLDDAPAPSSGPGTRKRIFPALEEEDGIPTVNLNVETEDEEDQLNILLEHKPKKGKGKGMKRKSRVFEGVDSLLASIGGKKEGSNDEEEEIDRPMFNKLMAVITDGNERRKMRAMFKNKEGRIELARMAIAKLNGSGSSGEESNEPPKKNRKTVRGPKGRTEVDAVVEVVDTGGSDGDGEQSDDELPIRRKRKTAKGKANKATASVPLPKTGLLAQRLNGRVARVVAKRGEKSRTKSTIKKKGGKGKGGQKKEKEKAKVVAVQKAVPRRSKRGRKSIRYDDVDSEEEEEGSDFIDDGEAEDEDLDEDEEIEIEVEDEDDDDDDVEDDIVLDGGSLRESEESDDDFVEEEPEPQKKKPKRKNAKKSQRRKRTRPTDVFQSDEKGLSEAQVRERLDFLVKQSADIAQELHNAMAEATSTQPAAAASKLPARRGNKQVPADVGEVREPVAERGSDEGAADNNKEVKAVSARKEEKLALPTGPGRELQPHQLDGVKWFLALDAQGLNAILADEMGLGKTIQAITFLASLVLSGSRGPHLVIAPKNVCDHWATEVMSWYPGKINVVTHLGMAEERLERLETILEEDNFDILVTSYDIALRDLLSTKRVEGCMAPYRRVLFAFRKVEFEYLIVDEAQRLKNDNSKLNIGIRRYRRAQRRLLLTGTPLSNNLKELWSLMNVLNPRIFSSKTTFEAWFAAPFDSGRGGSKSLTHAEQSVIVDRLHTILRPFFRRRVRADVCPTFTSADEVVVRCPMSELQKALMLHFRRRADSKDYSANNLIMYMRMASSHPFTLSDSLVPEQDSELNAKLVSCSGKFVFLNYSLPRLLAGGHRVLIFVQFRKSLDYLEDLMDSLGVKYGRLDGTTPADVRLSTIADFNSPGSELQIFLLTTRAGGVGINLQTADTVILFDSDWNPSADLQAVSRIQRIGQKKTVHIMRLLVEKSADEYIFNTTRRKLRTQAVAVGAGKFNTSSGAALDQNVRQKDLEQLLQEMDIANFMPLGVQQKATPAPGSQDSPESISPLRAQRDAKEERKTEWNRLLLRCGEESLPEVSLKEIWIDEPNEYGVPAIPMWLGANANIPAARRAIEQQDPTSADHIYKETMQRMTLQGAYSKKDRAARARRIVTQEVGSDLDSDDSSEAGSSEDPSANMDQLESESTEDEDFVIDELKNDGANGRRAASKAKSGISELANGNPKATSYFEQSIRTLAGNAEKGLAGSSQPAVSHNQKGTCSTTANNTSSAIHVRKTGTGKSRVPSKPVSAAPLVKVSMSASTRNAPVTPRTMPPVRLYNQAPGQPSWTSASNDVVMMPVKSPHIISNNQSPGQPPWRSAPGNTWMVPVNGSPVMLSKQPLGQPVRAHPGNTFIMPASAAPVMPGVQFPGHPSWRSAPGSNFIMPVYGPARISKSALAPSSSASAPRSTFVMMPVNVQQAIPKNQSPGQPPRASDSRSTVVLPVNASPAIPSRQSMTYSVPQRNAAVRTSERSQAAAHTLQLPPRGSGMMVTSRHLDAAESKPGPAGISELPGKEVGEDLTLTVLHYASQQLPAVGVDSKAICNGPVKAHGRLNTSSRDNDGVNNYNGGDPFATVRTQTTSRNLNRKQAEKATRDFSAGESIGTLPEGKRTNNMSLPSASTKRNNPTSQGGGLKSTTNLTPEKFNMLRKRVEDIMGLPADQRKSPVQDNRRSKTMMPKQNGLTQARSTMQDSRATFEKSNTYRTTSAGNEPAVISEYGTLEMLQDNGRVPNAAPSANGPKILAPSSLRQSMGKTTSGFAIISTSEHNAKGGEALNQEKAGNQVPSGRVPNVSPRSQSKIGSNRRPAPVTIDLTQSDTDSDTCNDVVVVVTRTAPNVSSVGASKITSTRPAKSQATAPAPACMVFKPKPLLTNEKAIEKFTELVDRLRDLTEVQDDEYLVDALLATKSDLGDAVKYISSRISRS